MERIHHGQQDLADPFCPAKIHDIGLIIGELGQASELFRPGINVENDSLGFAGCQANPGISIAPWIAFIGGWPSSVGILTGVAQTC